VLEVRRDREKSKRWMKAELRKRENKKWYKLNRECRNLEKETWKIKRLRGIR
jgi:hypothetical protein